METKSSCSEFKTKTIYFTRRPTRIPNEKITTENQQCQSKDSVKYLGVHLDKKLLFRKQIESMSKKGRQVIGSVYPLLN